MIAGIVAWLVKKGLSETAAPKVAKVGLTVATVALAAGLFFGWLALHDRGVVKDHEADISAEVEKATNDAEDAADDAQAESTAEFEAKQDADKKEIDDAKRENRSPLDALFN